MHELEIITDEACCRIPNVALLPEREAEMLAGAMKAMGHPIRLQIMHILSQTKGRLCVCEIEAAFDVSQPTVSHHLRTLREAGLVDAEQRGLYLYYRIRPETRDFVRGALRAILG
ncbi:MAG TPA: metalloregulator ArsR/SmtB family transcription factor [Rhodothermales bacterium]